MQPPLRTRPHEVLLRVWPVKEGDLFLAVPEYFNVTVTFWVMELDRLKVQVNSPPLSEAESGVQERDTVGFVVEPTSVNVNVSC